MFISEKKIKVELDYLILCFILLLSLVFINNNLAIGLILAISFLFICFLYKKSLIIYAIVIALFFEGYEFSFYFFSARIRLVQVIEVLGIIVFLILIFINKVKLKKTPLGFPLFAYVLVNFIAIINAPSIAHSLKISILLLSLVLLYYLVFNLLTQKIIFEKGFNLLLYVGLAVASFGIYQVIAGALNYYINTNLPIGHLGIIQVEFLGSPWGRPYSTFVEPDWYGAVSMFYSILFISLYFSKFDERKKFYLFGAIISVIGMLLSFVRASWIGFIAGIVFLSIIGKKLKASKFKLKTLILILSSLVLLALFMTLFSPAFGEIIEKRFTKEGAAGISIENARFKQMRQSVRIFLEHPIIGSGPGSFALKGIWGDSESYYNQLVQEGKLSIYQRYDPSIITTILADTGIIGALFFLLFLFIFVRHSIKVLTKINNYYQAVSLGLFAGIIGLFSSYIFSNGFWIPFTWVFLGFNIAALNLGVLEKKEIYIESTNAK